MLIASRSRMAVAALPGSPCQVSSLLRSTGVSTKQVFIPEARINLASRFINQLLVPEVIDQITVAGVQNARPGISRQGQDVRIIRFHDFIVSKPSFIVLKVSRRMEDGTSRPSILTDLCLVRPFYFTSKLSSRGINNLVPSFCRSSDGWAPRHHLRVGREGHDPQSDPVPLQPLGPFIAHPGQYGFATGRSRDSSGKAI